MNHSDPAVRPSGLPIMPAPPAETGGAGSVYWVADPVGATVISDALT